VRGHHIGRRDGHLLLRQQRLDARLLHDRRGRRRGALDLRQRRQIRVQRSLNAAADLLRVISLHRFLRRNSFDASRLLLRCILRSNRILLLLKKLPKRLRFLRAARGTAAFRDVVYLLRRSRLLLLLLYDLHRLNGSVISLYYRLLNGIILRIRYILDRIHQFLRDALQTRPRLRSLILHYHYHLLLLLLLLLNPQHRLI